MLKKNFLFEWKYFTCQPSFYITSLIFFTLAFLAPNARMSALGAVFKNSPYSITFILIFLSIFSIFLVINFVASCALRDRSSGMQEILYCKPLQPTYYQLGRFLGSFSLVLFVFSLVPLGLLLGSLMPWVDQSRIGPFQLSYYSTSFLFIAVPTIISLSCIFYTLAIRFRSMMAVYLAAVVLFILNEASEKLLAVPELRKLMPLFDPFAWNTFYEVTQYWTNENKNTQTLSFDGALMVNRLFWMGIGLFFLGVFARLSHQPEIERKEEKSNQKTKISLSSDEGENDSKTSEASLSSIMISVSENNQWKTFLSRVYLEVSNVVFSQAFIVLASLSLILLLSVIALPQGLFGNRFWPTTQMMVSLVQGGMSVLSLVVIAYYSAEIVWREREAGIEDIVGCTRVSNFTFWFSKLIAIWVVLVLLLLLGMVSTILFQLSSDYQQLDLKQYVVSLLYFNALPWMMISILALLLQIVSPNKYLGMFLFILFMLSKFTLEQFGFEHKMFQFSESTSINYSEMNGYGIALTRHTWYMLYWGALSLVMSVVGYGLWQRGVLLPLKTRLRKINERIGRKGLFVIVGSALVFVLTGSNIFYNTRVLNKYFTTDELLDIHANYEKRYSQYAENPIPTIIKLDANVDIFPQERKVVIEASVVVENKSSLPIDKFLVSIPGYSPLFSPVPGFSPVAYNLEIDGGELESIVGELNTRWFNFKHPLQPGEKRMGHYTANIQHQGFAETGKSIMLVENGTFIQNNEVFPRFGYVSSEELLSPSQRAKRNLPPPKRHHKLTDSQHYNRSSIESILGINSGYLEFAATVSTSSDQIAIAPGYLQREWHADGRRYFRYQMDSKIQNYFAFFSGRFEKASLKDKGVDVSVYFHPDHSMNVRRIQQAMQDSIEYYSSAFGPYQHQQIKVIEFPGPKNFGQSFPNTIAYSEAAGFIHDLRGPLQNDQVYWFIAHEVAHQWWGAQLDSANVQGSMMLVETLAQYSAFMLIKRKYGVGALRRMLKFEMDRYLQGRSRESIEELPLMKVENQPYIHYNKGSIVMMALADLMTEERLNQVLSNFLNEYKFSDSRLPTTLDFMRHISNLAKPDEMKVINDLFAEIHLYDLKITDTKIEKQENGFFDIELTLVAVKHSYDGKEKETEIGLSELVDLGVFVESPDYLKEKSEAIYLEKHRIVSGENKIKISVKQQPGFIAVDPFLHMIDRNLDDNLVEL